MAEATPDNSEGRVMIITHYEFGRIVVGGETHTHDVIIHPDRVTGPWWRKEGHRLYIDDLADVWDTKPGTIVVGTGYYGQMTVADETWEYSRARGIEIIATSTRDAVATFNDLQAGLERQPERRIVAALHLTC